MKNNIDVAMLGDSITNRGDWKTLFENLVVLNFGIDGDTTSGVLNRVNSVIELEPKVVVLIIGINDLCISVPIEDVFNRYIQIVEKLKSKNIKLILNAVIITQIPTVNRKVKVFNEMIKNYAKENNIVFTEINSAFENDKGLLREDLTTDGLHLCQKAYKVWAYRLKSVVEKILD